MRKNFRKLTILTLLASNALSAATNIKHTLLSPRPVIDDLAIEKTGQHNPRKFKEKYGYNFHKQASLFTRHSVKGEDVGKYFGVNGTNQIAIKHAASAAAVIADNSIDIWDRFLIHDHTPAGDITTIDAIFNLNPKQEVYALRLDFFGLLNNPIPRTFFKLSAPITYIETDLHTKYNTNIPDVGDDYISQFFNGSTVNATDATNLQDQLEYGKIDGNRKTVFGVADIDAHFGYRLVDGKTKRIYLSGLVTIPTGNRPKAIHLFEPIYGNGNHLALGWELDGSMRLWKKKRHTGSLDFTLRHKYTFEGSEKRIIPLNLPSYPFAHYYLAGKVGQVAGTALFPAANVLAQNITVRPGNSVEGMLNLKFKTARFMIDTGYNIYYKEKENMHLRTAWSDDVYAIANASYNTTAIFNVAAELVRINNDILDLNGALTPSQLSHKVFANIGYNFDVSKHPMHIGVGGSYEFADNNYELEGYEFWIKTSCAF
ncbi:MAG: hypothetical protein JXR36_16085 [Bacteroidales bacterium]|nr:hypothetical protein [Bacteroidales bacterium]